MKLQTLQLVLTGVLVLALAGAVSSCRGSRKAFAASNVELTNTSNQLAKANARLVELEAARKTLELQIKMQRDDLNTASNRIAVLQDESRSTAAEVRRLRQELKSREAALADARTTQARWTEERAEFERVLQQKDGEIRAAQQDAASQRLRAQELSAELNRAEGARALLEQQLNDPATLRARLAQAQRPVGKGIPAERDSRVVINSDGTVSVAPQGVQ